jgi:hypothetical protein
MNPEPRVANLAGITSLHCLASRFHGAPEDLARPALIHWA